MNIFIRIYITIAALAVLLVPKLYAQQDMTLYYLTNVYESNKTNPAFKPNNKFAFQFVNLNFGFYNSGFYAKQLKTAESQADPGAYLVGKLNAKNYLTNTFSTDLFSFRVRIKTVDFTFNVTENYNFRLGYPRDLFALAWYGNGDPYFLNNNRTATLDGLGLNAQLYHEIGFAIAHTIKEKFTYGLKYKYLIGVATVNTTQSSGSIYTDPANSYAMHVKANFLLQTAGDGVGNFSLNNAGDATKGLDYKKLLLSQNNRGHAFDIGISYKPTEKWTINASAVNIGYIQWNGGVHNYSFNGDTIISGVKLRNLADPNVNFSADSITKAFKYKVTNNGFRTLLTPQIFLGGNYNINAKNKVGVLVTAEYYNNEQLLPGVTAGYTKTFGRAWDVALTYSYFNRNPYNIGFGTALRFWCFESYFVTDNLFGMIVPAYASNINLRLGTNVIFGRGDKKPKETKIKDKDGDGIPDDMDLCPTIPGSATAKGCPDMDKDSIPDSQDSCKTVPGLRKFNGCPDTDGDGIPDKLDRCPTEFGLAIFHGCPDTDGDSIPDLEDSCRTVKGLKKFHGCPDTDGDGIPDYKDACPDQYGPVLFNGCPDSDGDGIPDNQDDCPLLRGVKENKGCPVKAEIVIPPPAAPAPEKAAVLTKEEAEVINKVFSNLEFENGKAMVKESSYAALEGLYDLLNKKPKFNLKVAGYTDNVGSSQANIKLSQQRANAVKNFLTNKGIDGSRINAEGFGPAHPVAPNTTPAGRAKNRRVEFTILE